MEVVFFVVALLAEIIGTIAGFGSSMILLPVGLLFFDFKTALVVVAFMHFFGNLGRIAFFRKGLNWRILGYFGVVGLIGTILGAWLVDTINQEVLKACLGVFLMSYGVFSWFRPNFRLKQSMPNMIVGGVSSGFLAGLIGTGGALRGAFLTAFNMPKTEYIGTAAAIAIAVDGTRIPIYINIQLLSSQYYWMIPILFVLAIAGSYIGRRLVSLIPQAAFRKVVLVSITAAGLKLFSDYIL